MGLVGTALVLGINCVRCGAGKSGAAVGMLAAYLSGMASSEPARLMVTEVGDSVDTASVEIRGVQAGAFDPQNWANEKLHWMADTRSPMMAPREGEWRNIYAPSAVETDKGWAIFYGGWDGVPTGKDRIYATSTSDFLAFDQSRTVIEHGVFQHVCNVNALAAGAGGFEIVCTTYPDARGKNKPAMFRSADGVNWEGTSGAHHARLEDIVTVTGYDDKYPDADINGMNVILREDDKLRLYFGNFLDFGKVFRATSTDGTTFTLDGISLEERLAVNDVKKFRTADGDWYLMGAHMNRGELSYSLSRDGLKFDPSRNLFKHLDETDRHMVAIGWVVQGDQEAEGRKLLGVLYGAGAVPSLDKNRIFARWLQKRVVLADGDGNELAAGAKAHGPDRQLVPAGKGETSKARVRLFAEDGVTLIGESEEIELKPGRAYQVRLDH